MGDLETSRMRPWPALGRSAARKKKIYGQTTCTVLREDCALLGCYAASSDYSLQTFRENLWAGPIGFPKRRQGISINCHYTLRNNPEEGSPRLLRGGSLNSRAVRCVYIQSDYL